MARRTVTLSQIARRTGVHESTVSRALNERTRHLVADDVAARIMAMAQELGYRPNIMAAALRTRRSMAIGVIVDDLADPTTTAPLAAIEATLRGAGYVMTVTATGGDATRLATALDTLDGRGSDGAILLDRTPSARADGAVSPIPLVSPDDLSDPGESGIGLAVAHLVRRGHRAIGHLAGPPDRHASRARLNGFRTAMTAAGLFVTAIETCDAVTDDAGSRATAELLARRPNLTALIAADDRLAFGALDALAAASRRCPQEVSLIGLGDLPVSRRTTPPLSTVRLDAGAVGRHAAELLLTRIGATEPAHSAPATAELVERGSTGAAAGR